MSDLTPQELRDIRVGLGLTQREMAQALRLQSRGGRGIREFEHGERNPSGPVQYLYELFRDGVIAPTK